MSRAQLDLRDSVLLFFIVYVASLLAFWTAWFVLF